MRLRLSVGFPAYLVGIHLVFAGAAVLAMRGDALWLLGVELFVLLSLAVAFVLFRQFYRPLRLLLNGAAFLRESDFSTRLRPAGLREMDELIEVYNAMIDSLREERLRLQEHHYLLQRIIDASPSGIVLFDFDGRCTLVNPAAAQLTGRTPEELVGVPRAALDRQAGEALAALQPGGSVVVTMSHKRVQCHLSEFVDRGFTRTFLVMEELTDEVRRVEKAAYEKVIRTFSHEVNNSIGAANSLLQSCLHYRDQLRDDDRGDFDMAIHVAVARGRQLCEFVQRYADVFRLPPPRLQPCDLRQMLGHIGLLLSAECRQRRIRWRLVAEEELPQVAMDKAQMEQVFLNLCKNAVEAIGTDGIVTVYLGMQGRSVTVVIEDTGHGIADDILHHIHTPFFTTKDTGQGIGLTMAQEVLSRHGFEFSIRSAPGGPTRCTICCT